MAFSIESLAPELLLEIMVLIPNPASLYNFIVASPIAYRIFNRYAFEIFMSVIISPETATQTRCIIETMAHVRSRLKYWPDRIKDLNDIRTICLFDPRFSYGHVRTIPPRDAPMANPRFRQIYLVKGTSLSHQTPAPILRSLLADAARIQRLANLCLADLLNRLRKAQFKRAAEPLPDTFQPWDVHAIKTETYAPRLDRQLSWTEEHRISKTAWRLQLMRDLQRAAKSGVFDTQGWPAKDKLELKKADMKIIFQLKTPADRLDINSISNDEWLYHEAHTFLDWLGVSMPRGALPQASLPDLQAILVSKEAEPGRVRECLPVGPRPGQDERYLIANCANAGFLDYADLCRIPNSLLRFTTFGPFRRLGLAIWDLERLEKDLGLHVDRPNDYSNDKVKFLRALFVQWDNILSPEDKAKAEGRRAAREELDALKAKDKRMSTPGRR